MQISAATRWWVLLSAAILPAFVLPIAFGGALVGLVVVFALAIALHRQRGRPKTVSWRLLVAGAVLWTGSSFAVEIQKSISPNTSLAIGDFGFFVGLILIAAGLYRAIQARTAAVQVGPILDGILVASWQLVFVMVITGPALAGSPATPTIVLALASLPFDLLSTAFVVRLITGSRHTSPSVALLALANLGGFTASTMVLWSNTQGLESGPATAGFAGLALVSLLAALSHPSIAELEHPVVGEHLPQSAGRPFVIAGSYLTLIALVAFVDIRSYLIVPVAAVTLTTTGALAVLTRNRESALGREQRVATLTEAISYTDSPSVTLERGLDAVRNYLGGKAEVSARFVTDEHIDSLDLTAPGSPSSPETAGPAEAVGAMVNAALRTGDWQRAELFRSGRNQRLITRLVVPLTCDHNYARTLIVEATPVLTTSEISHIVALTRRVEESVTRFDLLEAEHQSRSINRFRLLVEDSSDILVLIDDETLEPLEVSPSAQHLLGQNEKESGADIRHRIHPDDDDTVRALIESVRSGQEVSNAADVRVQHRDGTFRWFTARIRDRRQHLDVGALVLSLTDIDARKIADLSRARSEELFRSLVHSSKDIHAIIEPDLTISYISPNVESVLGFRASDILSADFGSLVNGESAFMTAGNLDDYCGQTLEVELRTADNGVRQTEVTFVKRPHADHGYMLIIRDITEQRSLEKSLRDKALFDDLTGLANRETLYHQMQGQLQRLREPNSLGVIHLDVINFKDVTETVGFESANELLVEVAGRLRDALRDIDVIGRLDGSEFVICTVAHRPSDLCVLVERVREVMADPFTIAGLPQQMELAIGYSQTSSRRADARMLMEEAALALRAGRNKTTNRVEEFEPGLRHSATERFELSSELRKAIVRGELSVVYQPIVDMATRRPVSVEALMRWTHPSRGPISPGVFIPLAEQSGLIVEFGRWIMDAACRQLHQWHHTLPSTRDLTVSVNVSALQLERPGEAAELARLVSDSGVDPCTIVVELTESTLIEDAAWIRNQLDYLRDQGLKVAIDDFGTGAAGFGHLRDVPFDILKIDRSYVSGIQDSQDAQHLVKGVIDLAHRLGAITVAEGIECHEEFEVVRLLGCERAQGFLVSRPLDQDHAATWFNEQVHAV